MPDSSLSSRAPARRVFHPITRPMALTAKQVQRTRREVPDPGQDPGITPLSDAECAEMTARLMRDHDGPLWIFAYGSLIWNPGFPVGRIRRAVAHGWHRSFCLKLTSWRDSPEFPGLMMALERGGSTTGLLTEVPPGQEAQGLEALLRREMPGREHAGMARWIKTRSDGQVIRALTFWAGPTGPIVVSGLPPETVA